MWSLSYIGIIIRLAKRLLLIKYSRWFLVMRNGTEMIAYGIQKASSCVQSMIVLSLYFKEATILRLIVG